MVLLRAVFRICRLSTSSPVITSTRYSITTSFSPVKHSFIASNMSQRSISSFFTKTPRKSGETDKDSSSKTGEKNDVSPEKSNAEESPAKPERRTSKRQRLQSDSSEGSNKESPVKTPPTPEQKKKKRQRIISSESEPSPVKSLPEEHIPVKLETASPKTYNSPKSKKARTPKTPLAEKNPVKEEKESPEIKKETKNRSDKKKTPNKAETKGKDKNSVKKEKVAKPAQKEKKQSDDEEDVSAEDVIPAVYDPAKQRYEPRRDASWRAGQPVPYLALAATLEAIEGTSARLRMIEILSNYFRSVIALTPEDLLPSVYLCLNQLAPAHHSLELGIAETYLMKAVAQCTGRSLSQVKALSAKTGDLGAAAAAARAAQRVMFPAPALLVRRLFAQLKETALMTGQASVNKKIAKIQSLYVACKESEAKFLIRSLAGKLRIGLAEQSVLQALAQAATLTPPGAGAPDAKKMTPEELKALIDENALIIKSTYCACPDYGQLVPVLLRHGLRALPVHCRLTAGVPLKPMLAHPTKGVAEIFNRFEGQRFTCEYKYDGERAQIHVPARSGGGGGGEGAGGAGDGGEGGSEGGGGGPDLARAAIFSRNQEDNTGKYPDILKRLPGLLKDSVQSCVLDCEAVAYDVEKKQILPFQVLSTRKRKDVSTGDVTVQVCVFVFDLLLLNGRALVAEPLAVRRALLRDHFREVEGEWQFATSADCSTLEQVQRLLDEAVRGSCEGLMVKTLEGRDASYEIARRSRNWLKLKKDYLEGIGDTIDALVIGAYRGRGKRAGAFGGFLLACPDPETDQVQSLCKIGTGFSDEALKTLTEDLQQHVIDAPPSYYRYDPSHEPDVWLRAAAVWEVRCADLSLSPAHRAAIGLADPARGVSLRFPRFVRVRDDKTPETATSARQIADMYLAQDQVKNVGKTVVEDDFY